ACAQPSACILPPVVLCSGRVIGVWMVNIVFSLCCGDCYPCCLYFNLNTVSLYVQICWWGDAFTGCPFPAGGLAGCRCHQLWVFQDNLADTVEDAGDNLRFELWVVAVLCQVDEAG